MELEGATVHPTGDAAPDTDWLPALRRLVGYWAGKRGDAAIPRRADIDPVDIPTVLPDLWMIDVVGSPPRFRYRLVGTRIATRVDHDPTGKWVEEAFPRFGESGHQQAAARVVETGVPCVYSGPPLMASDPDIYRVQRATLPLRLSGDHTEILLGLSLFMFR